MKDTKINYFYDVYTVWCVCACVNMTYYSYSLLVLVQYIKSMLPRFNDASDIFAWETYPNIIVTNIVKYRLCGRVVSVIMDSFTRTSLKLL